MPRTEKAYLTKRSGQLARDRVRAGLSRAEAARRLGIAASSLGNIERGAVQASQSLLDRMASVYALTVAETRRSYRVDRKAFLVRER